MTNEQAAALARMRDDLVAADARFAKLEMVASTAASQRDAARAMLEAARQRADHAVALLRRCRACHPDAGHPDFGVRQMLPGAQAVALWREVDALLANLEKP